MLGQCNQDSKRKCSHGMLCDNKNICARCSTCTEVTILCFVSTCIAGLTAFSKTSAISQLYRKERHRIRRTSKSAIQEELIMETDNWRQFRHPAPRLPVPPLDTPLSKKMKLFSKRYRSTPQSVATTPVRTPGSYSTISGSLQLSGTPVAQPLLYSTRRGARYPY